MIKKFFIYGGIGWSLEIIWTGITGLLKGDVSMIGHTSVWMLLIYGGGGLLFEPIHGLIYKSSTGVRGLVWMYLIFLIEFVCGLILKLIGIDAWTYDNAFSILGVIRLDYAPLWFVVGLLYERVHLISEKIVA